MRPGDPKTPQKIGSWDTRVLTLGSNRDFKEICRLYCLPTEARYNHLIARKAETPDLGPWS